MNLFVVFMLLFGFCAGHKINNKVVFCYYGTWATYRTGDGKFDVDDVNPHLCSHIAYSFAGINETGTIISLDPYLDLPDGRDNFKNFVALKNQNPDLKTLLAVGGWNEGSAKYSTMAASPALRSNFIQSALEILLEYGFDGLDLDWEYPNRRDTVFGEADIENFSQLLKELRIAFDEHYLILTAAVAAVEANVVLSYDVPTISEYLDLINIMAYDFHGSWDPVTGHNAALYKGEGDENADENTLFTVDNAIQYWLGAGAAPEKLILGVPFYGRTFTLSSANEHSVGSPASGAGISGPYTLTNGFLGYNEFCVKLQTESWTVVYDNLAKVPYAYRDLDWVSFDDSKSIRNKVNYAKKYKLGGIMMWSIETDDLHANCGPEDFPLLRTINRGLGRVVTPSVTTSTTTTTTTSPSQPESFECKKAGFLPHPNNCNAFNMCVLDVHENFMAYEFFCPDNLYWDQSIEMCNYPEHVQCNN